MLDKQNKNQRPKFCLSSLISLFEPGRIRMVRISSHQFLCNCPTFNVHNMSLKFSKLNDKKENFEKKTTFFDIFWAWVRFFTCLKGYGCKVDKQIKIYHWLPSYNDHFQLERFSLLLQNRFTKFLIFFFSIKF